jgi:hypothetical protein
MVGNWSLIMGVVTVFGFAVLLHNMESEPTVLFISLWPKHLLNHANIQMYLHPHMPPVLHSRCFPDISSVFTGDWLTINTWLCHRYCWELGSKANTLSGKENTLKFPKCNMYNDYAATWLKDWGIILAVFGQTSIAVEGNYTYIQQHWVFERGVKDW